MVDHFDRRRVDRRMLAQEVRTTIVGGKDDRVTLRQRVKQHREILTAPARFRAKPRGDDSRRLLLLQIWRGGKDHRQFQRAVVARVKERHREVRKIVTHFQRTVGQIQGAVTRYVQPDGIVGRVFAHVTVVADKLQANAVKIGDVQRIDRDLRRHFFT